MKQNPHERLLEIAEQLLVHSGIPLPLFNIQPYHKICYQNIIPSKINTFRKHKEIPNLMNP